MRNSDARRRLVLNAIIEDYIATREPVGSKAVARRHNLGVSPATIRNDMAQLEEAGLIVQPHTSAGRIPTDSGYRAFVDAIADIKPLSVPQRKAIEQILTQSVDLDDVVNRAVRLLAQITQQVAVVQYPSLQRTLLRHIELVALSKQLILIVLIANTGRVEQRTVEVEDILSEGSVDLIRKAANEHLVGMEMRHLGKKIPTTLEALPPLIRPAGKIVFTAVAKMLQSEGEEKVVVAGTGNLSRYDYDFAHSISPVLDLLEEQVILLRLITQQEQGINVKIGSENTEEALAETSIVSTNYGVDDEADIARLGIIGPTRMDYRGAMAGVYAVAQYLTSILSSE